MAGRQLLGGAGPSAAQLPAVVCWAPKGVRGPWSPRRDPGLGQERKPAGRGRPPWLSKLAPYFGLILAFPLSFGFCAQFARRGVVLLFNCSSPRQVWPHDKCPRCPGPIMVPAHCRHLIDSFGWENEAETLQLAFIMAVSSWAGCKRRMQAMSW